MIDITTSAGRLRHAITVLHSVNDNTSTLFTENGISSHTRDAVNVCGVSVQLPHSTFDKYEVKSDHQYQVDLSELLSAIAWIDPNETVNIIIDGEKLVLSYGIHHRSFKVTPSLHLQKLPKRGDVEASMVLSGKDFRDILIAANGVDDVIAISAVNDTAIDFFSCREDDSVVYYRSEPLPAITTPDSKWLYATELLIDITQHIDDSDVITVMMFDELDPCEIGCIRDGVQVTWWVAPRLEA